MSSDKSVVKSREEIYNFFESARGKIVIVAPYIKSVELRNALNALPTTAIDDLICVSRWLPSDLASGSCDSSVYEDVQNYGGKFFVHPHLHAKYYRAGNRCLIGSANLTGRGFGRLIPANLELLIEVPSDFPGLELWENKLISSAIQMTDELCEQIIGEANRLIASSEILHVPDVDIGSELEASDSTWIPSCPVPDRLWDVYNNRGVDTITTSAREKAMHDLSALELPRGLSKSSHFNNYVASILLQMPLISEIDRLATTGLTDVSAKVLISEKLNMNDIDRVEKYWRVLKEWLMYFFPNTYRLEAIEEVFVKSETILRR